jgi:hypothetical protein
MDEQSFDIIIIPLDILINRIYLTEIESKIPDLQTKYGNTLFINPGSLSELSIIFKTAIKKLLTLLSKQYIELLKNFFSEDGLIYYIESAFYKIILKGYSNV